MAIVTLKIQGTTSFGAMLLDKLSVATQVSR